MDRQNTDPALIAVCVAATLLVGAFWTAQALDAKDAQIRQLELDKAAITGQMMERQ